MSLLLRKKTNTKKPHNSFHHNNISQQFLWVSLGTEDTQCSWKAWQRGHFPNNGRQVFFAPKQKEMCSEEETHFLQATGAFSFFHLKYVSSCLGFLNLNSRVLGKQRNSFKSSLVLVFIWTLFILLENEFNLQTFQSFVYILWPVASRPA